MQSCSVTWSGSAVTSLEMPQDASTPSANRWNASAILGVDELTCHFVAVAVAMFYLSWRVKPTCWLVMSRLTCTVLWYSVSLLGWEASPVTAEPSPSTLAFSEAV